MKLLLVVRFVALDSGVLGVPIEGSPGHGLLRLVLVGSHTLADVSGGADGRFPSPWSSIQWQ